ncbi:outer membrane beta-barrel protein [Lysobacter solisilvae (ex Woo and Kim 2020)]|uniref:Outer membrane beta-barrel protein n=1 Tax=Agrilutibacter terrestris TaxID=2865112 RepID=A0A7H0G0S6_9GAMM|nr:diffusible signal factor-reguated Ax21 faimly protein [Lysobacter terrestris]QNP41892.1 outer membrane beta-barrel protein [Lysobacter terrestris]
MKKSLLALTLLVSLPFAASAAEGLSYNYVEGGYVASNGDNVDADGWNVNGSAALTDNFHVFGGYTFQKTDDETIGGVRFDGVDVDQWRVGLGYNHPIAANTDLLARVAYESAKVEGFDRFDGYSAEVGVRSALAPNFEGYALAGYEDGDDVDGDFYGRVGAQVKFNQNWGVTGDVKFADGDTQYFVGPRLTF